MKAHELRKGDQFRDPDTGFLVYVVTKDAKYISKDKVLIQVRYTDGGFQDREFPANQNVAHVRP